MGNKRQHGSVKGIWAVGGLAVACAAALILLSLYSADENGRAAFPGRPVEGQRNIQGQANAKVTLVEYGDYL